jgi:RNA polymerase sigma-70 factor (ECF subfamily)
VSRKLKSSEQTRVFDDWTRRHQGLLFKVIRAYAFNAAARDALFQEIAIPLNHSIPSFRGESSEATWIYRVALYAAIAWSKL